MCEFCIQHGEGKKWYLQAKNYSEELFNEERKRFIADFFGRFEETMVNKYGALDKLIAADPAAFKAMLPSLVEQQKKDQWSQVVPLEDVEQILDMSLSVVRLPCVCRSTLQGRYDARYCFGVTTFVPESHPILEYPDWSADLELLTKEEAKKAFQKLDRNGLVHSVRTFITPYVGAICNCSVDECIPLKLRLRVGFPALFKAEYVASIDWESCNGCRDCKKQCNFGAISYSPSLDKCYINEFQCYGCGVCRAICREDAITLRDRNAIPVLAKEW